MGFWSQRGGVRVEGPSSDDKIPVKNLESTASKLTDLPL